MKRIPVCIGVAGVLLTTTIWADLPRPREDGNHPEGPVIDIDECVEPCGNRVCGVGLGGLCKFCCSCVSLIQSEFRCCSPFATCCEGGDFLNFYCYTRCRIGECEDDEDPGRSSAAEPQDITGDEPCAPTTEEITHEQLLAGAIVSNYGRTPIGLQWFVDGHHHPSDQTVIRWQQYFPYVLQLQSMSQAESFIATLPTICETALDDNVMNALRKTIVQTVFPILVNDPKSYIDQSVQRGECLRPEKREWIQAILSNEAISQGKVDVANVKAWSDARLVEAVWRILVLEAPWEGISLQGSQLVIARIADQAGLDLLSERTEPRSDVSGLTSFNRIMEPPQNTVLFPAIYADVTLWVKHRVRTELIAPYTLRLIHNERTGKWHPVRLTRGVGSLISLPIVF